MYREFMLGASLMIACVFFAGVFVGTLIP